MGNKLKTLNVLALLLSIFMMTACLSPEQRKLREEVDAFNSTCPVNIFDGVSIDKVTYADNVVTYYASVNTPLIPLKLLSKQKDKIQPIWVAAIKTAKDPKVKEQIDLCREAGATIKYVLSNGKDELTFDIDPQTI